MVALCYMLCLYVYGLQQYGQLNNSCPLGYLFCSVMLFKVVIITNLEQKQKSA